MDRIIIKACLNGGRGREDNPNVPWTPEEVAQEAIRCYDSGASIVHIHARTPDGGISYDPQWYTQASAMIRAQCDLILNYTTARRSDAPVEAVTGYLLGTPNPVEISGRMEIDALNALWSQPAAPMILDVRQRAEFHAGHIPGALNIELGELQDHLDGLPREIPIVTVCAAGMRATIAGSILHSNGRKNIQVVDEHGTPAWIERGYPSATGEE